MQENAKQKEEQLEQLNHERVKDREMIKKLQRQLVAKQDGSLEVATVASVEEGIPDDLWLETEKHSESTTPTDREQVLLGKIKELEQQIENIHKLEENRRLKEQSDNGIQQVLEDAVKSLQDEVRMLESKRQELEKEVDAKAEGEVEMLSQINELQEELTKAIEMFEEVKQEKEQAKKTLELQTESGKELEREKEAVQKQLNESRLQISTLKVCDRYGNLSTDQSNRPFAVCCSTRDKSIFRTTHQLSI